MFTRTVCGLAVPLFACVLASGAFGQTPNAPPASVAAPAPKAPASIFPPANPKFFTATTPTVDTVNAFLKQLWGYDENRIWSVVAILQTKAPGVAKVVVYVADKNHPDKSQQTVFFTTPDGKHAIADNVIDFGVTPFLDTRKVLQERAAGAAHGAAGKEFLLVEFTDLQCPHCKDAQPLMDQLETDFPQARVVVEDFPLVDIHPFAFQAAAEGACLRKSKGEAAYFKYVQAVFDTQGALTDESAAQTLANAVTKAGGDPVAVAACAKTPAGMDPVNASSQMAKDLGIDATPMLFINGMPIPLGGVPYEVLKKIVAYRANQDGIAVKVQPSLKTLK